MNVPQLAYPLRIDPASGTFAVVEQDSVDDVAGCVEVVLRTRVGDRDELPEFGIPDLTFLELPLDLDDLVDMVSLWEPRAELLIEEAPQVLNDLTTRLQITVGVGEGG
jgi:phage baseplate assembly protein W